MNIMIWMPPALEATWQLTVNLSSNAAPSLVQREEQVVWWFGSRFDGYSRIFHLMLLEHTLNISLAKGAVKRVRSAKVGGKKGAAKSKAIKKRAAPAAAHAAPAQEAGSAKASAKRATTKRGGKKKSAAKKGARKASKGKKGGKRAAKKWALSYVSALL